MVSLAPGNPSPSLGPGPGPVAVLLPAPTSSNAPSSPPRSSGTASLCWCSARPCPSSPGHWVRPRGGGRVTPGTGVSPGLGCPDQRPPPPPLTGITRFDLLGDFGRFNWLGNFYIVFLYNMGFAGLTTLCLVKKVSWAVQAELIRAFGEDGDVGTGAGGDGGGGVPVLGSHALPLPRSAQAATACDPLPAPRQARLGDRDVCPPATTVAHRTTTVAHRTATSHGSDPDGTWCFRDVGAPHPWGGLATPCSVSACRATEPWP